jgi:hypothetical protein
VHRGAVPRRRLGHDAGTPATGDVGGAVGGAVVHDDDREARRHPWQQVDERRGLVLAWKDQVADDLHVSDRRQVEAG